MKELLERIQANGLKDLEGLRLQATLPLTSELANEALSALKDQLTAQAPAPTEGTAGAGSPSSGKPSPAIDPKKLLPHLRIHELRVSFEEGRAVLHVDIAR